MNKTIAFAFIALILVQITLNQAITCPDGQVLDVSVSSTKCTACSPQYTACHSVAAAAFHARIVGFGNPGTGNTPYCTGTYYNKNTNNCEQYCI